MSRTGTLPGALEFQEDGIPYLRLCADITVYWEGSVFERVEGVLDFYGQAIELIREHLTFYGTETTKLPRKVDEEALGLLPFWLTKTRSRRTWYMLDLESGSTPDAASDWALTFRALEDDEVGAMRLVLPTGDLDGDPGPFVELVKALTRSLDLASGHAGYAVSYVKLGDLAYKAEAVLYPLGRRHPGIDLPDLFGTLDVISEGIKCINWLTLLSPDLCERLGGLETLVEELGEEIAIHPLATGVMIQAGPRAEIGDVNRGSRLPLYHQVGRVLAPIRAPDHPPFLKRGPLVYDEDATERWLGRFDW
jgi:hypothetical protein